MLAKIVTAIALAIVIGATVVCSVMAFHLDYEWERCDILEASIIILLVVWFICDRFDIGWWKNEEK